MADVPRVAGSLGGIDFRLEEDLAGDVVVTTGGNVETLVLLVEVHATINECATLVCTHPE